MNKDQTMSEKKTLLRSKKKNTFKVTASPELQQLTFNDKKTQSQIQQLMNKILEVWLKTRRYQRYFDMQKDQERLVWLNWFHAEELEHIEEITKQFITVLQIQRQYVSAQIQKVDTNLSLQHNKRQYDDQVWSHDLPRMNISIEIFQKTYVESQLFLSCEFWKSEKIKTQAYLNRMLDFLAVTTFVNLTELEICEMEIKNLQCLITLDTPNLQSLSIGSYHLSNIKSLAKYRFPEPMKKFTLGFEFVPAVSQFSRSFERGNILQELNTKRERLLNYQYQGMGNANTLNYLVKSCLPSVQQLKFKLEDLPCSMRNIISVAASEHIGQTVKEKQRLQRKKHLKESIWV